MTLFLPLPLVIPVPDYMTKSGAPPTIVYKVLIKFHLKLLLISHSLT